MKSSTNQKPKKNYENIILFLRFDGTIHKEFIPPGCTLNAVFSLALLKCLVHRIRRSRPEHRKQGRWCLFQEYAFSSIETTKNRIFINNHSPHSPDLQFRDFCLFRKLHLSMKGRGLYRYSQGRLKKTLSTCFLMVQTLYRF